MPPRRRKYNEQAAPHGMAAASSKVMFAGLRARGPFLASRCTRHTSGPRARRPGPRFESSHLFADGHDFSGEVRSEDALPRSEEPEDEPNKEWVRLSLTDVPRGHGRREHADQDLIILRGRFVHFLELEDIRRSVPQAHNRSHWILPDRPRSEAWISSPIDDWDRLITIGPAADGLARYESIRHREP